MVDALLHHYANFPLAAYLLLAPNEPGSCIAPDVARHITETSRVRGGRRAVSGIDGTVIARTLRLESLVVGARGGDRLTIAPFTVAVLHAPRAHGAGGWLGLDFLGRFSRITYEIGPPDTLVLEEP